MAKCLPVVATLFPDISAMPLRWIPGFERIIVYVVFTLSFSVSFSVSYRIIYRIISPSHRYREYQFHLINLKFVFQFGFAPFGIFPSRDDGWKIRTEVLPIAYLQQSTMSFFHRSRTACETVSWQYFKSSIILHQGPANNNL